MSAADHVDGGFDQPMGPGSELPDEVTAALVELLARPCVVSPAAGIPPV